MPECQKIRKDELDQYGAERFGRLIFATIRKNVGMKELNTGILLLDNAHLHRRHTLRGANRGGGGLPDGGRGPRCPSVEQPLILYILCIFINIHSG